MSIAALAADRQLRGTPLSQILSVIGAGGDYWPQENVHLTGGNVDTWTGANGRTLTDGGVSGRRPAVSGGNLVFTGSNSLQGSSAVFNGSRYVNIAMGIKNTRATSSVGQDLVSVAPAGVLSYIIEVANDLVSTKVNFWSTVSATEKQAENVGHDYSTFAVWILQADLGAALGSIVQVPQRNTVAITATLTAGTVSPATMPNSPIIVGANSSTGFAATSFNITDLVCDPHGALWTAPQIATITTAIRNLRGY